MKLWCHTGKNVIELSFSEKISFFPKIPPKLGFFGGFFIKIG